MKTLRLLIVLGISFFCLGLQAQSRLSIDSASFNNLFNQQQVIGGQDTGTLTIKNTGNTTFNDTLYLNIKVNDSTWTTGPGANNILQYNSTYSTLAPGASVAMPVIVHYTGPAFMAGPSVVVIWPSAFHPTAFDTIAKQIVVQDTATGVNDMNLKPLTAFVLNGQLHIEGKDEIAFKCVRIFDISGAAVLTYNQLTTSIIIDVNKYATGTYLVEVTFADNKRQTFKIVSTIH